MSFKVNNTDYKQWLKDLVYIRNENGTISNCVHNQAKLGFFKLYLHNLKSSPKHICWDQILQGMMMLMFVLFFPIVIPVCCYIESKQTYRDAQAAMISKYIREHTDSDTVIVFEDNEDDI
jgi:isocitrate dehydrogenase kinase/phosphatase